MSSFTGSTGSGGGGSLPAAPTRPSDDGYIGYDPRLPSQRFDSFSNFVDSESVKDSTGDSSPVLGSQSCSAGDDAFSAQVGHETPSPPSIFSAGADFSSVSPEQNGKAFDAGFMESNGPILPTPAEMQPEEGFALSEWRRQNAIQLLEKEKEEKDMLRVIIEEAEEYKVEFYRRRKMNCETNKATNREKEKLFLANREKFHAEVDKNYWKAVAELIPREVVAIEKRGKKEQEKKPSIVVIQGPKPGKPTDLSRMRQILVRLKHHHHPPPHMKPKAQPPPSLPSGAGIKDAKTSPALASPSGLATAKAATEATPEALAAA